MTANRFNILAVSLTLLISASPMAFAQSITVLDARVDIPNLISSSATAGTAVIGISLAVRKSGRTIFDGITWSLSDSANGLFAIDPTSGEISLAKNGELDYENGPRDILIRVTAVVVEEGVELTAMLELTINVIDGKDVMDVIAVQDTSRGAAPFLIRETDPIGALVVSLEGIPVPTFQVVTDRYSLTTSNSVVDDYYLDIIRTGVVWSLSESANGLFDITQDGQLFLASGSLDYETSRTHEVVVQATVSLQGKSPEVATYSRIIDVINQLDEIYIRDIDSAPNTISELATESVISLGTEEIGPGRFVSGLTLEVMREVSREARQLADRFNFLGIEGREISATLSDSADGLFSIDEERGYGIKRILRFIRLEPGVTLDYEREQSYVFVAEVTGVFVNKDSSGITVDTTTESTLAITVAVENELESIAIEDRNTLANTILELAEVGSAVSGISLQVRDEGNRILSDELTWSLSDSANGLFAINSTSGVITLAQSGVLDYESQRNIPIQVSVTAVRGSVTLTETFELTIDVSPIEIVDTDSAPNRIFENAAIGVEVMNIAFEVRDSSAQRIPAEDVIWRFFGLPDNRFVIDSASGQISLNQANALDSESEPNINLTVEAAVQISGATITAQIAVPIDVIEYLNESDTFNLVDSDLSANEISENAVAGTAVSGISLQVLNEMSAPTDNVAWSLTESAGNLFAIDAVSGEISLALGMSLDYESTTSHTLEVTAELLVLGSSETLTLDLVVAVLNESDTFNLVDSDLSANEISESASAGTTISGVSLQVLNEMNAPTDGVVWDLSESASGTFAIDKTNGEISLAPGMSLDYESTTSHTLEVIAELLVLGSSETLTISLAVAVLNESDTFNLMDSDLSANEILESASAGTTISGVSLQVLNEMNAPTDGVVWDLSESADNPFAIDETSGVILLAPAKSLDYESTPSYTLEVTAELLVLGSSETLTLSLGIAVLNESDTFNLVDSDASANSILESAVAGTAVSGVSLQVLGEINVLADNVAWSLSESADNPFAIDETSGEISLAPSASLDYEAVASYTLEVIAELLVLGSSETLTLSLDIAVLNESDTFNLVDSDVSANSILESAVAGTAVSGVSLQVLGEMNVLADNVVWSLSESADNPFAIDETSGEVSLAPSASLDYEAVTNYTLEVTAELLVLGSSETLTLSLGIAVLNESDTFNLVDSDLSANEISENAVPGTAVSGISLQVLNEMDAPTDGVVWDLSESANNPFAIDETSGEISLAPSASLDYESVTNYTLEVTAELLVLGSSETLTLGLVVAVLNESDTFNLVDNDASANQIAESASAGTAVSGVLLQVLNEMNAPTDDVFWSLTESADNPFAIDETSGEVSLAPSASLDYEAVTSYTLEVTAELLVLGSSETLTLSLDIAVLNESDTFNLVDSDVSANEIAESAVAGTAVSGVSLQVLGEMNVLADNVVWSLSESADNPFAIDETSGEVSLAPSASLDYEAVTNYTLEVTAELLVLGSSETLTLDLVVAVLNESDTFNLVDSDASANSILESAVSGTAASGISLQVLNEMNAPTDGVVWDLSESANGTFAIDETSGVILLAPAKSLDYESTPSYTLVAIASVSYGDTTENLTISLVIAVLNESDTFNLVDSDASANEISENAMAGTAVSGVSLQVLGEMNVLADNVVWSLTESANGTFAIDETSGEISLAPSASLDYEAVTSHTLEVTAELLVLGSSETLTLSLETHCSIERI